MAEKVLESIAEMLLSGGLFFARDRVLCANIYIQFWCLETRSLAKNTLHIIKFITFHRSLRCDSLLCTITSVLI